MKVQMTRCGSLLWLTLLLLGMPTYDVSAAEVSLDEGASFQDCSYCPEMVVVPAGSFMMGSTPEEVERDGVLYESEARWEQPKRKVEIGYQFAAGKHEVTRDQYKRFVEETDRKQVNCKIYIRDKGTWGIQQDKNWRDPGHEQTGQHPVVCVKWADARDYAAWLSQKTGKSYRLLSEAEWEYTARGGTTTSRFWGEDRTKACQFANISGLERAPVIVQLTRPIDDESFIKCDDGHVWSAPVGSFAPNGFGLHDTLGNVWEWTADCFYGGFEGGSYEGAPVDGSARTTGDCTYHAFRGGAFSSLAYNYRTTQRAMGADPKSYADDPREYRADYLGFRVARDLN